SREELRMGQEVFTGAAVDAQGEPFQYSQHWQFHELKAEIRRGEDRGGRSGVEPERVRFGEVADRIPAEPRGEAVLRQAKRVARL
ncbi:MAG: hypothetical protein ACK6D3_14495, partial [Planctomycetaceae bacterium]